MKKKTPSSIRSKHKKYESLEVDNITLEEHEIESYMEEIILNSPNKHNNNKNNHGSNSSMTAKKIHCVRFLGLFMMFLSAAFFLSMSRLSFRACFASLSTSMFGQMFQWDTFSTNSLTSGTPSFNPVNY